MILAAHVKKRLMGWGDLVFMIPGPVHLWAQFVALQCVLIAVVDGRGHALMHGQ